MLCWCLKIACASYLYLCNAMRHSLHPSTAYSAQEEEKAQRKAALANSQADAPVCGGCGKPTVGKRMSAMDQKWHPECFVCHHCGKPFSATDGFVESEGKPYHEQCLDELEDAAQLTMQLNHALFEAARQGKVLHVPARRVLKDDRTSGDRGGLSPWFFLLQ